MKSLTERLNELADLYEGQATLFYGRRKEWRLARAAELRDLALTR